MPGPADSTKKIIYNVPIGVDAQASLDCQKGARHCIETAQLQLTLSLQCGERLVDGVQVGLDSLLCVSVACREEIRRDVGISDDRIFIKSGGN